MRVRLLTAPGEWGGTEGHTLELARTLAGRGHQVVIVELGRHAYGHQRVRDAGAELIHVGDERSIAEWGCIAWIRALRPLGGDVAVLAKGFIDAGSWELDLAARMVFPRFLSIEHLTCPMPARTTARHVGGLVPGIGLWWHRMLARRVVRGVWPRTTICVSGAVQDELARSYRFARRKLVTVRNGIDTSRFTRDVSRGASLRASWGIPADALVMGAVGRLSGMKCYDVALDAFATLTTALPARAMWLVLAGDGPSRASLEAAARERGVSDRVVFPGYTDRPEEVYSALDVFLMPSRTEGLPLALLEAMACGCCPIATAVGGIPEVITERSLGWLVPAGSGDGFYRAMQDAAASRAEELGAMAVRARQHVCKHFDARAQFGAVADVIEGGRVTAGLPQSAAASS